jgi:purine-binding chemotaxis protein CheW
MSEPAKNQMLVLFRLDEQHYALHLSVVERVVRAVEVTPLPKAPEIISGVINVQGQIIPVVDVRKLFRLPAREMELDDHIMIARAPKRLLALPVDSVEGVGEYPEEQVVVSEKIVPGMEYVEGVLKLPDGLILIHNLEKFLSLKEENALDGAMGESAGKEVGLRG